MRGAFFDALSVRILEQERSSQFHLPKYFPLAPLTLETLKIPELTSNLLFY